VHKFAAALISQYSLWGIC